MNSRHLGRFSHNKYSQKQRHLTSTITKGYFQKSYRYWIFSVRHRLCDHSQTHPLSLAALDEDAQRDEILDAREDLAGATKAAVPYFRAPGGNWSPEVQKLAAKKKMQPLGWTVDPRDWSLPGTPAIVSRVQGGVGPGAIVLMHDGGGPRQQTVDALTTLLPWLVDHGYRFTFPTP